MFKQAEGHSHQTCLDLFSTSYRRTCPIPCEQLYTPHSRRLQVGQRENAPHALKPVGMREALESFDRVLKPRHFLRARCQAGLKRLRKKDCWRANLPKSIPQGLKPTLVLRHLRHATQRVPRSCPDTKPSRIQAEASFSAACETQPCQPRPAVALRSRRVLKQLLRLGADGKRRGGQSGRVPHTGPRTNEQEAKIRFPDRSRRKRRGCA